MMENLVCYSNVIKDKTGKPKKKEIFGVKRREVRTVGRKEIFFLRKINYGVDGRRERERERERER